MKDLLSALVGQSNPQDNSGPGIQQTQEDISQALSVQSPLEQSTVSDLSQMPDIASGIMGSPDFLGQEEDIYQKTKKEIMGMYQQEKLQLSEIQQLPKFNPTKIFDGDSGIMSQGDNGGETSYRLAGYDAFDSYSDQKSPNANEKQNAMAFMELGVQPSLQNVDEQSIMKMRKALSLEDKHRFMSEVGLQSQEGAKEYRLKDIRYRILKKAGGRNIVELYDAETGKRINEELAKKYNGYRQDIDKLNKTMRDIHRYQIQKKDLETQSYIEHVARYTADSFINTAEYIENKISGTLKDIGVVSQAEDAVTKATIKKYRNYFHSNIAPEGMKQFYKKISSASLAELPAVWISNPAESLTELSKSILPMVVGGVIGKGAKSVPIIKKYAPQIIGGIALTFRDALSTEENYKAQYHKEMSDQEKAIYYGANLVLNTVGESIIRSSGSMLLRPASKGIFSFVGKKGGAKKVSDLLLKDVIVAGKPSLPVHVANAITEMGLEGMTGGTQEILDEKILQKRKNVSTEDVIRASINEGMAMHQISAGHVMVSLPGSYARNKAVSKKRKIIEETFAEMSPEQRAQVIKSNKKLFDALAQKNPKDGQYVKAIIDFEKKDVPVYKPGSVASEIRKTVLNNYLSKTDDRQFSEYVDKVLAPITDMDNSHLSQEEQSQIEGRLQKIVNSLYHARERAKTEGFELQESDIRDMETELTRIENDISKEDTPDDHPLHFFTIEKGLGEIQNNTLDEAQMILSGNAELSSYLDALRDFHVINNEMVRSTLKAKKTDAEVKDLLAQDPEALGENMTPGSIMFTLHKYLDGRELTPDQSFMLSRLAANDRFRNIYGREYHKILQSTIEANTIDNSTPQPSSDRGPQVEEPIVKNDEDKSVQTQENNAKNQRSQEEQPEKQQANADKNKIEEYDTSKHTQDDMDIETAPEEKSDEAQQISVLASSAQGLDEAIKGYFDGHLGKEAIKSIIIKVAESRHDIDTDKIKQYIDKDMDGLLKKMELCKS